MHVLKIIVLLALTLAVMRLASWGLLWLLRRVWRRDSVRVRLAANALALAAFAAFLLIDRVPGQFLDAQALAFGVVVFGVCFGIDTKWLPGWVSGRSRRT
jgi:hypothetical protein